MTGEVQFNNNYNYDYGGGYQPSTTEDSFIYRLVYKTGLAKDKKGAEKVLLVVLILAILGIAYFMFSGGPQEAPVEDSFVDPIQ